MRNMPRIALVLLMVLLAAPALCADDKQGSLVIIGGALRYDQADVWNRIVALAGGAGARIAVVPVASSEPLVGGSRTVDTLRARGADAFLLPLYLDSGQTSLGAKASDPELVAQIRSATGVYFIGGSQERITQALGTSTAGRTPLLDAVWHVYQQGGVIAGTSAGAAVMSQMMFRHSRSVLQTLQDGLKVGDELVPGLGFLDAGWFVEQHCLARGRFGRTLVAMHTLGLKQGVGVDENTAVVVERGQSLSVLGYRGAIVLDLSQATTDCTAEGFRMRGARLSYLDRGDALDLATLAVTPASDKRAEPAVVLASATAPRASEQAPAEAPAPLVVADILGRETVVDVLAHVVRGRQSQAIGLAFDPAEALRGPVRGFEFRFYRDEQSRGWETHARGDASVTVSNVRLDIRPVQIAGPLYQP
jgi:cyanophycinase